jgi:hypothetical protein
MRPLAPLPATAAEMGDLRQCAFMLRSWRVPSTNGVTNERMAPAVAQQFEYSFQYSWTAGPRIAMTIAAARGACNVTSPWRKLPARSQESCVSCEIHVSRISPLTILPGRSAWRALRNCWICRAWICARAFSGSKCHCGPRLPTKTTPGPMLNRPGDGAQSAEIDCPCAARHAPARHSPGRLSQISILYAFLTPPCHGSATPNLLSWPGSHWPGSRSHDDPIWRTAAARSP